MKIGVMGAGQLGQMLALAANRLALECRFVTPDAHAPAARYAETIIAEYANLAALAHFTDGLDVATYEFESIPAESVRWVAERVRLAPPALALETAQDRVAEKSCFDRLAIPTARWRAVESMAEVREGLPHVGLPCVLKSRRFGYDGKGQAVIRRIDEIGAAWVATRGVPAIVEAHVSFSRELSLIAVRSADGETAFYPLVENHHSEGILRFSLAPAPAVSGEIQRLAEAFATRILDELHYVGVLAIEFFEAGGQLVANEMAPRVHNSGHWTIEGADTSQFENHLRAVTGMKLGSTGVGGAAGMVNIIGREPNVSRLRALENVHVHMYGKTAAPRRKLGHITVTGDDLDGVRAGIARVRSVL